MLFLAIFVKPFYFILIDFNLFSGASGAENRHRSHLRHEDPAESRHAREGTGVVFFLFIFFYKI